MSDNNDDLYEQKKAYYEEKKAKRIDRLEGRAKKARQKSNRSFDCVHNLADRIPFGQPILVGHHSEKRARRDADKIHNGMMKGIEEEKKADYYEQQIAAANSNRDISSDDPDAISKLKEKIAVLSARRNYMKKANKEYKKYKQSKEKGESYKMDLTDKEKELLLSELKRNMNGDPTVPFAPFEINSVSTKIRNAEKRIEQLTKVSTENTETKQYRIEGIPGVVFEKNVVENRFKVFPPKKEISIQLGLNGGSGLFKKFGFVWCHTDGCFQRKLSTLGWLDTVLIEELKKRFLYYLENKK